MNAFVLAALLAVMQTTPPVPRQTANSSAGTSSHVQSQANPNKTQPAQAQAGFTSNAAPSHDASRNEQGTDDAQHSISISKLPPVTVVTPNRDWADWGYWVFSGLLVVVGGLQVWLLCRTLNAIQRQADILEAGARQWVGIQNWQIANLKEFIDLEVDNLSLTFDVINPTDYPLTLESWTAMIGATNYGGDLKTLLPPKAPYLVSMCFHTQRPENTLLMQGKLIINVIGTVTFVDVLKGRQTQTFRQLCVVGQHSANFL